MQRIGTFIQNHKAAIIKAQLPVFSVIYTLCAAYGIYLFQGNFIFITSFIAYHPDIVLTLEPGSALKLFTFVSLFFVAGVLGSALSFVSLRMPRVAQGSWFTTIIVWYIVFLGVINHYAESIVHFAAILGVFLFVAAFIWTFIQPQPESVNA
ncbi:hypothetical protein [Elstera sp.]|jgi:hypothetical protein|uniref:hypothetical protein n=1 Tax=Elstera sp. TaxID=1916664 RepID=UPI0037BFE3CC